MAVGIAAGTVIGFGLFLVTDSVFLIYLGAIIGVLIAFGYTSMSRGGDE